jgi:hypothetical protein
MTTPEQEGLGYYRQYTKEANARAQQYFAAALTQDSTSARAEALLAATYRQDANMAWVEDVEAAERIALRHALSAVNLARLEPALYAELPHALEQLGWVYLYQHRHADCLKAAGEAIAYAPTYANAYALAAHAMTYKGQVTEALQHQAIADTLDQQATGALPFLSRYHQGHIRIVQALKGQGAESTLYEEARQVLTAVLDEAPHHRPSRSYLAVVLWKLGQTEPAHVQMAQLEAEGRLAPSDPRFEPYIRRSLPYTDAALLTQLIEIWQAAA